MNISYFEMYLSWLVDGNCLLFVIDELSVCNQQCQNGKYYFNLVELDVVLGIINNFDFFFGVDNFNLEEDVNGNIVFFLNCDGYCNFYCYEWSSEMIEQLMDLIIGVSGIMYYVLVFSIDCKWN